MSVQDPGVIHDASLSWNGYNHQGKIALYYAISQLTALIDRELSDQENIAKLESYFLELEYLEDFSVGQFVNGGLQYSSVHQVKARNEQNVNQYESALLGLVNHLRTTPSIAEAYLHTTELLDLNGKDLLGVIKEMVADPTYPKNSENEIINSRQDPQYRKDFTKKKRGRPSKNKAELQSALLSAYPSEKILTDANLDKAFDARLKEIREEISELQLMEESVLKKVKLFSYNLNGGTQQFCEAQNAKIILKKAIKEFFDAYDPTSYKTQDRFVDRCYLYILGQLDQHIVDRSINYAEYRRGIRNRQILFSDIFQWLISDEIDQNDEAYYLSNIKETIFENMEKYCHRCPMKNSGQCIRCQVPFLREKIGSLSFERLEQFLRNTNPDISEDLNMRTYGKFSAPAGMYNPLLKCLRDISQTPAQTDDEDTLSYNGRDCLQYVLTAIAPSGTDDDEAIICSEIIRNKHVYNLLMDYDCLISRDISVDSIQDNDFTLGAEHDPLHAEHIAHCKNTKIVPLEQLKANNLLDEEDE